MSSDYATTKRIDPDLIKRCQAGDQDSFRVLFEAYKDRIYGIAAYFGADEATAKDITQEVFVRLFTRIADFRWRSTFDTWLYRLVVNCCMDEHRARKRLLPLDLIQSRRRRMETKTAPHEEAYLRAEITGAVQATVRSLKPKLRMPVVLRYLEELSYDEIAVILDCSPGTVASRLNRAHRALARKLAYLASRELSQDR